MKKRSGELELPFEDEAPPPVPFQEMFGIQSKDLQSIREVALRLDPDTDFSQMGAWGILFLVCGAMAGETPSWKATVFENLRIPNPIEYAKIVKGEGAEPEYHGIEFRNHIQAWNSDKTGQILARQGLKGLADQPEKFKAAAQHYFGLAIILNSLPDWGSDPPSAVRRWAEASPEGWQTLFFAAGLLLSDEPSVRWEAMRSVILATSEVHRKDVEALLNRYSSQR